MNKRNSPNHRHEKLSKRDTDESPDPYLNEQPAKEPAVCSECGNIYHNKQWYLPGQVEIKGEEVDEEFVCPGCMKVSDNYYFGELLVSGKFMVPHSDEITHLIDNEVDRAQEKNPLQKVVEATEEEGKVVIRTTNGKLAERLGRALKKAYEGELEIDKSEQTTRVFWERNDLPE